MTGLSYKWPKNIIHGQPIGLSARQGRGIKGAQHHRKWGIATHPLRREGFPVVATALVSSRLGLTGGVAGVGRGVARWSFHLMVVRLGSLLHIMALLLVTPVVPAALHAEKRRKVAVCYGHLWESSMFCKTNIFSEKVELWMLVTWLVTYQDLSKRENYT